MPMARRAGPMVALIDWFRIETNRLCQTFSSRRWGGWPISCCSMVLAVDLWNKTVFFLRLQGAEVISAYLYRGSPKPTQQRFWFAVAGEMPRTTPHFSGSRGERQVATCSHSPVSRCRKPRGFHGVFLDLSDSIIASRRPSGVLCFCVQRVRGIPHGC